MIALCTFFTKGWCYSMTAWAEHAATAIRGESGHLVLATDDSKECEAMVKKIAPKFPKLSLHHLIIGAADDRQKAYQDEAQLIIARLQQAAFAKAREVGADQCWSVESDVLVPPNALRVLRQSLEFDDGYYSVAMVTYPNGQFLGGRGTPHHPIAEDFTFEERQIPDALQKEIEAREKRLKDLAKKKEHPTEGDMKEWGEMDKRIRECPPKGNIFELQAKGWRKRGWLESAYPAIGRGAILPTDWVGLGCTLLNQKALDLATFEGYELKGTQDLFLCWNRWHPHGLRMCVIPHIVCSHVKRKVDKDGHRTDEIEVHEAYHELGGEYAGHLRWRLKKFYDFNTAPSLTRPPSP
jgi:hypothetical protein